MVKLFDLPCTSLSLDPETSSIELLWTSHSRPRILNVTHVELEYPLMKMMKTSDTSQ